MATVCDKTNISSGGTRLMIARQRGVRCLALQSSQPSNGAISLRPCLLLGRKRPGSVVPDIEPTAWIFGIAPEFFKPKVTFRTTEHIHAHRTAWRIDRLHDLVFMCHGAPHYRYIWPRLAFGNCGARAKHSGQCARKTHTCSVVWRYRYD